MGRTACGEGQLVGLKRCFYTSWSEGFNSAQAASRSDHDRLLEDLPLRIAVTAHRRGWRRLDLAHHVHAAKDPAEDRKALLVGIAGGAMIEPRAARRSR